MHHSVSTIENRQPFENIDDSRIAIVGMAGRFPGANNLDVFWSNLQNGVESITFFDNDQLHAAGIDLETLQNPNYIKARPLIDDIELFDAAFFGYTPREAESMDPQQRLFLECVWQAVENAGYDAQRYDGAISVFAGSSRSSYLLNNLLANPDAMALAGNLQVSISNSEDALATRVAYKMNLKGACYTIQTFCSTSLVAVHLACQSLLNFECDMAVAGGVSIQVPQVAGYWFEAGSILSKDGHCRPFDTNAQGTVFGNGLGTVVLKRLKDALSDGDHIEAVIIGSATNNDGAVKVSYTAPSVTGQAQVIAEALANADINPETITYLEAHGTGTSLGDPAEVSALTRAFRKGTQKKGFCALGSVKSNIGHLDRASGVAGLIKTVLCLKHRTIAPTIHFQRPNPDIDFANSPFYVNNQAIEWNGGETPRRAGVSSFGVGGTNAHVIVEEAPDMPASGTSRPYQLLVLSAKTDSGLTAANLGLSACLKRRPDMNFPDAAYTLQVGRKALEYRQMAVCKDSSEAISLLYGQGTKGIFKAKPHHRNPSVIFMFPGQGAQYVNMGRELYQTEKVFREQVDICAAILESTIGCDIRDILYPVDSRLEAAEQQLNQTMHTQPVLFTIEYALAQLWMHWGVKPSAFIGHSIGEYVAACLSGVFSLEDALRLVAARGKLIQNLPKGMMMAVFLSEKQIQAYLSESVALASVNGPSICVLSGQQNEIEALQAQLSAKKIHTRYLETSHAFHSHMMDAIIGPFSRIVTKTKRAAPKTPFLSNVTGTWIGLKEAQDPNYWCRHMRKTVRFYQGVNTLLNEGHKFFLEIGPSRSTAILVKQHPLISNAHLILSSMRHPKEHTSDVAVILSALGRLWLNGLEMNWNNFYLDERRHRVVLPTYPFQRERYWIDTQKAHVTQSIPKTDGSIPITQGAPATTIKYSDKNRKEKISGQTIEEVLMEIWRHLLGMPHVQLDDDYFDLGGNSLLAVTLFAQIEKIFQVKLPISVLYQAPTIRELSAMLTEERQANPWRALVPIQTRGDAPPLFLVHGAGGNVLIYRALAHHLAPDQPVYGLQARGLDGHMPGLKRIEEMAHIYLNEIVAVQPYGPYLLGGYCMGGTVAFEIAQQLWKRGERVKLLALLETYNFSNVVPRSLFGNAYFYIQKLNFHLQNFKMLDLKNKMEFLKEKATVAKARKNVWAGLIYAKFLTQLASSNGNSLSLYNLWKTNDDAAVRYVPKMYPGKIAHFIPFKGYAHHTGPEFMWDAIAQDGVETYVLPVYPAGMMVEPFVHLLAQKLKGAIRKSLEN